MEQRAKHTLCTYEHPAALHDIDSWRRGMDSDGRIHSWVIRTDGSTKAILQSDGEIVEVMIIHPIQSHPMGVLASDFMKTARSRDWAKWIHFGKMLFTPEQYRVAASRVDNLKQPRTEKCLGSEGI